MSKIVVINLTDDIIHTDTNLTNDSYLIYYMLFFGNSVKIGTIHTWQQPATAINLLYNRYYGCRSISPTTDVFANINNIRIYIVAAKNIPPKIKRASDNKLRKYIVNMVPGVKVTEGSYNVESLSGISDNLEAVENAIMGFIGSQKTTQVKEKFKIRNYQKNNINDPLFKRIKSYKNKPFHVIVNSATGNGKSTLAPSWIAEVSTINKGSLVLVTTPAVDTIESIVHNINHYDYGRKMIALTHDDIVMHGDNIINYIEDMITKKIIVVLTLSVQLLRGRLSNEYVEEYETLTNEYRAIINKFKIGLWIRDESHFHYNAVKTSKRFKEIKGLSNGIIDMTATPTRQLKDFNKDDVISFDLSDSLLLKEKGDDFLKRLPNTLIEAWETLPEWIEDEYEAFRSKKMFMTENGALKYPNLISSLLNEVFAMEDDRERFPYSIYAGHNKKAADKKIGFLVTPSGDSEESANERNRKLCDTIKVKDTKFISSQEIQEIANRRQMSINDVVIDIRDRECVNVCIVTHRKFLTGTNIPEASFIVLMDTISSTDVFIQMLGRILRIFENKEEARLMILEPGCTIKTIGDAFREISADKQVCLQDLITLNCLKIKINGVSDISSIMNVIYTDYKKALSGEITRSFISNFIDYDIAMSISSAIKAVDIKNLKYSLTTDNKGKNVIIKNEVTEKIKNEKRDINVILNSICVIIEEYIRIGVINNIPSFKQVLATDDAKNEFGISVCITLSTIAMYNGKSNMLDAIENIYQSVLNKSLEEQRITLFKNREYKKSNGIVYIDNRIVYGMFLNYYINNEVDLNGKRIFILNALDGALPMAIKERYPFVSITCIEVFKGYSKWLRRLGFESFDLDDITKYGIGILYKENKMEFYTGASNPPYNISLGGHGGTAGNTVLYKRFDKVMINNIMPNGFFSMLSPRGITKDLYNSENQVEYIDLMTDKDWWEYSTLFYVVRKTKKVSDPVIKGEIIKKIWSMSFNEWGYTEWKRKTTDRHAPVEALVSLTGETGPSKFALFPAPRFFSDNLNGPNYITWDGYADLPFCGYVTFNSLEDANKLLLFIKNNKIVKFFKAKTKVKSKVKDFLRFTKKFDLSQIHTGYEYPVEFGLTDDEIDQIERNILYPS